MLKTMKLRLLYSASVAVVAALVRIVCLFAPLLHWHVKFLNGMDGHAVVGTRERELSSLLWT